MFRSVQSREENTRCSIYAVRYDRSIAQLKFECGADKLRRNIEEPVVERSLDEIGSGTIQVGGEVARVQSGLLRTYAVAIAFSVVVLVVVFVAVR